MDKVLSLCVVVVIAALFVTEDNGKTATTNSGDCMTVEVTAYNNLSSQTDSTPNIAAWGYRLSASDKGNVVAVSPDVRKKFPANSTVWLEGVGLVKVVDKTNPRLSRTVDLYMHSNLAEAKRFGRRRGVKACRV